MTDVERQPVKPFTEYWYNRLPAYLRESDATEDLKYFLSLIADQLDDVVKIVDAVGNFPEGGKSALVDPEQANVIGSPLNVLKWQAQLFGVSLNQADSIDAQIDAVKYASSGWKSGTRQAIIDAAKSVLTGTKHAEVQPNYAGDPWALAIITRASETPNDVAVVNAILAKRAKPAGFVLLNVAFTVDWATIEATFPTWDDWEGLTWIQIEEADPPAEDPGNVPDPEEPVDPADRIRPQLYSVQPQPFSTEDFTELNSIYVTVIFTEEVNAVAPDFEYISFEYTDGSDFPNAAHPGTGPASESFFDGNRYGTTYTFIGDSELDRGKTVRVTVAGNLADDAGNIIELNDRDENGNYAFTFNTARDEIPPTVVSVTPQQGTTNVAIATPITITFSEPLEPSTVVAANFTLAEQKTTTATALTAAQENAFALAWAGFKTGYVNSTTGRVTRESTGDTTSLAMVRALSMAVMEKDQTTYDKVLAWGTANLKRSLPASGASDFLNCWARQTNGSGTVTDWDFWSGDMLDLWLAYDAAFRTWGRSSDQTLATNLATDIVNMLIVDGSYAYLGSDEDQVPNGHHQNGSSEWVFEINPGFSRPHIYRLLLTATGNSVFQKAIDGHYEMMTEITNNAGTLATTTGLPPNWVYYNTTTNTWSEIDVGVDGWTYEKDIDFGDYAVMAIISTYQDWIYSADARAKVYLSGALKTFFTYDWSVYSSISAIYSHSGSVPGTRYERNYVSNAARFALLAGDPTNATAESIRAQKLSNTLISNGTYQFFRADPNSTTSTMFGDSTMFLVRAIDTGLFARLMKGTASLTPVPFTLSYDNDVTVTLTPSASLLNSANYQINVSSAVTDVDDNALADSFIYSFSTVAAPALPPPPTPTTPWELTYFNDFKAPLDYVNDWWSPYHGPSTWNAGTFNRDQLVIDTSGTGILNIIGVRDPSRKLAGMDTDCIATGIALGRKGIYVGGAWETRLRCDKGKGFGPAGIIWPDNNRWPQDGEWDWCEMPGWERLRALMNHHYSSGIGGDGKPKHDQFGGSTSAIPGFSGADWHIYRVEWLTTRVSYYVDGILCLQTSSASQVETGDKMHWVVQLDIGKPGMGWIDVVDSTTPAQVKLQVDWVKQYKYTG